MKKAFVAVLLFILLLSLVAAEYKQTKVIKSSTMGEEDNQRIAKIYHPTAEKKVVKSVIFKSDEQTTVEKTESKTTTSSRIIKSTRKKQSIIPVEREPITKIQEQETTDKKFLIKVDESLINHQSIQNPTLQGLDYLTWTPALERFKKHYQVISLIPVFKHFFVEEKENHIEIKTSQEWMLSLKARGIEVDTETDYALHTWFIVEIEKGSVEEAMDSLRPLPEIKQVSPLEKTKLMIFPEDPLVSTDSTSYALGEIPGNPLLANTWGLQKIEADAAWNLELGSVQTVIAVIDSGIDATHPELAERTLPGYDFYEDDTDATDEYGHGTGMASIIASQANNNIGRAGVCWNCMLLPLKVTNNIGQGTSLGVANAMLYAVENDASIISLSLLTQGINPLIEDTIQQVVAMADPLIIIPAGNSDVDAAEYSPNNLNEVFTVAATNFDDTKSSFSNFGESIEVAAPGEFIIIAKAANAPQEFMDSVIDFNENFVVASGSSLSAAFTTGLAGLLYSHFPSLTTNEIKEKITSFAENIDPLNPNYQGQLGSGRINAFDALRIDNDMALTSIIFSNPAPLPGETVSITAGFENIGTLPLEEISITLAAIDESILVGSEGNPWYLPSLDVDEVIITPENQFSFTLPDDMEMPVTYGFLFIVETNDRTIIELPFTFDAVSDWIELNGSATDNGISFGNQYSSQSPDISINADNQPIINWAYMGSRMFLKKWNGIIWEPMSNSASGDGIAYDFPMYDSPAIALDSASNPLVVWHANEYVAPGIGYEYNVFLSYWNNDLWEPLGQSMTIPNGVSDTNTWSRYPDITVGQDDKVYMAWEEALGPYLTSDDPRPNSTIHVKYWDNGVWSELDGSATGMGINTMTSRHYTPRIAVADDGNIFVTWYAWLPNEISGIFAYVKQWNGIEWIDLNGVGGERGVAYPANRAQFPVVAVDDTGTPYVSWLDTFTGGYGEIYLKKYDFLTQQWNEIGGSASGGGTTTSERRVWRHDMTIGPDNNPVIAYEIHDEHDINRVEIYVKKYSPEQNAWIALGDSAIDGGVSDNPFRSEYPAVAVGPNNLPMVTWTQRRLAIGETSNGVLQTYMKAWQANEDWIDAAEEQNEQALPLLNVGNNFIGLQGIPIFEETASSILDAIISQGAFCEKISTWEGSGWKSYTWQGRGVDFSVNAGFGYWLDCSDIGDGSITVEINPTTEITWTLPRGTSFLSLPFTPLNTFDTAEEFAQLLNQQGAGIESVMKINTDGSLVAHPVGRPLNNFAIEAGKAYAIQTNTGSTVTLP